MAPSRKTTTSDIDKQRVKKVRLIVLGGILAFDLFLVVLAVSFFTWRNAELTALEAGGQTAMTERGPVEYTLTGGDGPVVLMLHGVTGGYDMSQELADIVGLQAAGYQVLSVSRPGYLGTPLGGNRTPEAQADLYAALLDELGMEQVAVVAVSGGGPSALAFANTYPDRVSALVMLVTVTRQWQATAQADDALPPENTPPILFDMAMWFTQEVQLRFVPRLAVRGTVVENVAASREENAALIDAILDDPTRMDYVARSIDVSTPMSSRWDGTYSDLEQLLALPGQPDYSGIEAPTLAIYGGQDSLVSLDHGEYLVDNLPNVTSTVVPESGHSPFFHESWPEVRASIADFIAEHAGE